MQNNEIKTSRKHFLKQRKSIVPRTDTLIKVIFEVHKIKLPFSTVNIYLLDTYRHCDKD